MYTGGGVSPCLRGNPQGCLVGLLSEQTENTGGEGRRDSGTLMTKQETVKVKQTLTISFLCMSRIGKK